MTVNTKKMEKAFDTKSEEEMKKKFQKSLQFLNKTEHDLNEIRKALKKTVNRLVVVAKGENSHINAMLVEIKSCVSNRIDIIALDAKLDELFSVLKQQPDINNLSEKKASTGREEADRQSFQRNLKQELTRYKFSSLSVTYRRKIQELVDKKEPDKEMVRAILNLIDELSAELSDISLHNDGYIQQLCGFDHSIRHDLFNASDVEKKSDTGIILDELAKDIMRHVSEIRKGNNCDDSHNVESNIRIHASTSGQIIEIFSALIDGLDIPEFDKNEKQAMIDALPERDEDCDAWIKNIEKIAELINKNISVLQNDKKDLSNFIVTITSQLADIEKYVEQTRLQYKDTASQSALLRNSLDDSVGKIQNEVRVADDICKLKQDVQDQLDTIRVNIESYKNYEEKEERISRDRYEKMTGELALSKKQTEELKQQLENSRTQLLRDDLTGLANRLAYNERILIEANRWKRNKESLCIAMWDIDNFKNINDTFGHDAGDRVLKLFAKIIVGRVRGMDLFARMGGEEFVLVMPDTPINTALKLNNKLRKALQRYRFQYNGEVVPVTASVGIAEFKDGLETEEVLKCADKALYVSKNSGRNRCSIFKE